MSDLPKRSYSQETDRLHADTELALKRVRDDFDAANIAYSSGTPGDWSGTPPTTVAEALDRLAAVAASPP